MIKKLTIPEDILNTYSTRKREFEKGDYLARTGSYPKCILYILSGNVKVVTFNDEGVEYLHGYTSERETIGIGTYLSKYAFYNDFIALDSVLAAEISLDQFEIMIKENSDVARGIMKYLSDIIEIKTLTLSAVMGKNPREMVLFALERIKRLELTDEESLIPFTRQEMANFLGVRVETIIRTVKELEEEGVLRIEKGKIYY